MPLFERGYRASAQTELERKLREIEEKDKVAQTKADFTASVNSFESNLNFAERINLVSAQQAELMRERAKKATLDHERMYRVEYGDRASKPIHENGRSTGRDFKGEKRKRIARE